MIHEDKFGQAIFMHSVVDVDEPTGVWESQQNAFRGTVVGIGKMFIVVEDQDGECFDLPPEHMEVVIPDDGVDFIDEISGNISTDYSIDNTGIYMIDNNSFNEMHKERICDECDSR
jgi:hypothetical protein